MIDFTQLADPGSLEQTQLERIDFDRLPRHIAVIMDGNGRWAKARDLSRADGHRAGVQAVRETIEIAARLETEVLTMYAFSVENWKRPRFEVWTLMNLMKEYLRRERQSLVDNNIRLRVLGRLGELDASVQREIERTLEATSECDGMSLNVAINYSGRCEIVDACREIVAEWARGEQVEIDEDTIGRYLYTSNQPDPDLVIRTSGVKRLSNFLLWQIAYSEIIVTETHWPDFCRRDLYDAIIEFQSRERRFGGVGESEPQGRQAGRSGW